jgi:hypothetical protein
MLCSKPAGDTAVSGRRIAWGITVAGILIAIVVALLLFADSNAITDQATSCASYFKDRSQSFAWFGCTMVAHEGLAGGLIGGAGALFAAWLAFTAVQEQLAEERQHIRQQQVDAKWAALVSITQPIHAAAAALSEIDTAIHAETPQTQASADRLVELAVEHVKSATDTLAMRESDLAVNDRLMYLLIVNRLRTFLNISVHPSPILNRVERLQNQRRALMELHQYLWPFDQQLAQVFARDSGTSAPTIDQGVLSAREIIDRPLT